MLNSPTPDQAVVANAVADTGLPVAPVPRARIAAALVLVVGDVMLDRYWFGDVSRISPEAPVPVVHVQRTEERAGGDQEVVDRAGAGVPRIRRVAAVGLHDHDAQDVAGDCRTRLSNRG